MWLLKMIKKLFNSKLNAISDGGSIIMSEQERHMKWLEKRSPRAQFLYKNGWINSELADEPDINEVPS
jgi:hypothetical protein